MKKSIVFLILLLYAGIGFSQAPAEIDSSNINQPLPPEDKSKLQNEEKLTNTGQLTNIEADSRTNIQQTNITEASNIPSLPSPAHIITNEISTSTNMTNQIPKNYKIDWGFFFLQVDGPFSEKFSKGEKGNNDPYYRMPNNSWNDNLYWLFSFDWKLNFWEFLQPRAGWCIALNFSGSGNGGDAIKVETDTDLGNAKGEAFYASFNSHKIPVMAIFRIQPLTIWIVNFYGGVGAGPYLGFFTYNELEKKDKASYEEQFEKTFILVRPIGKVFVGINFYTIPEFQTIFLEVNYVFVKNPIMTNDMLTTPRGISFQAAGLSIGFGFRF